MTGDVIQFKPRPQVTEDGYDGLRCPDCGCAWFRLGAGQGDEFESGVVALSQDGSVDGYSGTPHCLACGLEVLPS